MKNIISGLIEKKVSEAATNDKGPESYPPVEEPYKTFKPCRKFLHRDTKRCVYCGDPSEFFPYRKEIYCSKCFNTQHLNKTES